MDQQSRTPFKMLWFVFFCSILMYSFLALFIHTSNTGFKGYTDLGDTAAMVFYAFLLLAAATFLLLVFLRSQFNKRFHYSLAPAQKQNALIVQFALCDSIAIYGLVFFLLAGGLAKMFLFQGIAFFSMLLIYPQE